MPGLQEETESSKADKKPQTRSIVTFDTLPDPYALENMQAVYDSLSGSPQTLLPTHFYVRFKPQNQEQLEKLYNDYALDLYDYPLDIDIPEGVEYVDPTIPEGEPIWYYIVVGTDFIFPNDITYEIIRECYIPSEDEMYSQKSKCSIA